MNRYQPSYRPGFAEHPIPVPFAWFDRVAPWAIFALGVAMWAIVIWRRLHG
jgi:hypothetical protein